MEEIGKLKDSSLGHIIEWKIENFTSLFNVNKGYSSPWFYFAHASWNLIIYTLDKTGKSAFVYLKQVKSGGRHFNISLEIFLGSKTLIGKQYHEEVRYTHFEKGEVATGLFWTLESCMFSEKNSESYDVLTILLKDLDSITNEDCASGLSTDLQKNKILHDFKQLYLDKEDCDVLLKVKGQEFPAHKAILKARSPVFAATFRSEMKEKATGIVDIEDCEPSCFSDFLCFLYCGDVRILSDENVLNIFAAADKYDVQDLRAKCLEFIMKNLSVDTFCDTFTFALKHSETDLINFTSDFFTKYAAKIILTVKWKSFLVDNPMQSNELFIKLLAADKN